MTHFRIKNQFRGTTSFDGIELAHSDSIHRGSNPVRWVEMSLYLTESGIYVLDRVGMSLVYHKYDSDCDRGVRTAKNKLPEGAMPCYICRPESERRGETWVSRAPFVDMEEERHEVAECPTAEKILEALVTTRKKGAVGQPFLSLPAKRLLELAAESDAGIARVTQESERKIS